MLTYFSAENFKSIDEPIELNLKANNRLRHHKHHVRHPSNEEKKLGVLKTCLIYGANASGKSTIIEAIETAKGIICDPYRPKNNLKQTPFKLCNNRSKSPTEFYFELVLGGFKYTLQFSYEMNEIKSEELYIHYSKGHTSKIYTRSVSNGANIIDSDFFPKAFDKEDFQEMFSKFKDKMSGNKETEFKHFFELLEIRSALKRTPKDKLIISEMATRNFSEVKSNGLLNAVKGIYDYFKLQMIIITPNSRFLGVRTEVEKNKKQTGNFINHFTKFDTGIHDVENIPFDLANIPSDRLSDVEDLINLGDFDNHIEMIEGKYICFYLDKQKDLKADVINTVHLGKNGERVKFEISEESDGTRRLLDLLPPLIKEQDNNSIKPITYIIDEFNRSLHPSLARKYITLFTENSKNSDSQLIVTTHESELLDHEILRRDEIYFIQKEDDGSSKLYSLEDYNVRFDKDIRSAYLSGKFGAIPFV